MDQPTVNAALDNPGRSDAAQRLLAALPTKPLGGIEVALSGLAQRLQVPITAATVLDGATQHFIATSAGPHPPEPRETSHCQYVIASGEPLCISDVATDTVFSKLARLLLSGQPLNAYLGYPLHYEGHVVGAVCAVDVRARVWSPDDQYEVLVAVRDVEVLLDPPQF